MPIDKWNAEEVERATREGAAKGLVMAVERIRSEAISLVLDTAKTGRVYRRGNVEHIASAPGEPPASDTGRLVNSITTEVDTSELVGKVTARAEYAAFLEFGTQRMEPRPFMRPALANVREEITEMINTAVRDALG